MGVDPKAEKTFSAYGYCYNNPINLVDPTGMESDDWIKCGSMVFYDKDVNSQAKAVEKYGKNAKHLDEGSTLTGTTGGKVDYQYTFHDAGTITNKNNGVVDTSKTFETRGGTTIIENKSTINSLNPRTTGKNLLGLTYPGGENPKTYGGNYSYDYVPISLAEYPAIGHDRRYDNLGTAGASGLFTDTRAISTDYRFVSQELSIASSPYLDWKTRTQAGILGIGLGLFALPKTIGHLGDPYSGGLGTIMLWDQVANRNVNNIPSKP